MRPFLRLRKDLREENTAASGKITTHTFEAYKQDFSNSVRIADKVTAFTSLSVNQPLIVLG